MDGPQPINHRHADFQSSVGMLLDLYFNELAGRPLPDLHDDAGLRIAHSRKSHARHLSLWSLSRYLLIGCFHHERKNETGFLWTGYFGNKGIIAGLEVHREIAM